MEFLKRNLGGILMVIWLVAIVVEHWFVLMFTQDVDVALVITTIFVVLPGGLVLNWAAKRFGWRDW